MKELKTLLVRYFRGDETNRLDNFVMGYEGEQDFLQIVKQFIPNQGLFIKDFIFETPGFVQVDGVLIMPDQIHLYEVKNYDADCSLIDGKIYYNDRHINYNPLQQIDRACDSFKNILIQENIRIPVIPHLVLIHPYGTFKSDNSSELSILLRHELRRHFQGLQDHCNQPNYDPHSIYQVLRKYQIDDWHNHFKINPFNVEDLRRGIYCHQCGSFQMTKLYKSFQCQECSAKITKQEALKYIIAECCALYDRETISPLDVYTLCNKQLDKHWISNRMSELLKRVYYGHYAKVSESEYLEDMLRLYHKLKKK